MAVSAFALLLVHRPPYTFDVKFEALFQQRYRSVRKPCGTLGR